MTVSQLIEQARKKARVHTASAPDADVVEYLNEGIRVFSQPVGGINTRNTFTPATDQEALPADFLDMIGAVYGTKNVPLIRRNWEEIINSDTTGRPAYYAIFNKEIIFRPIPASWEAVDLYYRAYFTTFPDSIVGDETVNLPEEYHMALAYYAAMQLATDRFEYDTADRNYALFSDRMKQFHMEVANETTRIGFTDEVFPTMPGAFYPFKGEVAL